MTTVQTSNAGPEVIASTYWTSALARAGKIYASVNAGAIRILLPDSFADELPREIAAASLAVISVGPWPARGLATAIEIMWEDGTESPYALHLSPESFDLVPAAPDSGGWTVTTWDLHRGTPRKRTQHASLWRRVPFIPCLQAP